MTRSGRCVMGVRRREGARDRRAFREVNKTNVDVRMNQSPTADRLSCYFRPEADAHQDFARRRGTAARACAREFSYRRSMRRCGTRRYSATACVMVFACVCASLPRSAIADLVDDLMTFADESNEAYVVHLGSDSKASPLTADEREMLRDENRAVMMTAHDGKRYFCELPVRSRDDSAEVADADDDARAAFTTEERSALMDQKLDTAHKQGCFYRIEGWWTYEFCYKKRVRQYHQEDKGPGSADPVEGEFSLGVFDAEATAAAARDAAAASDPSRLQTLDSALAAERAHKHVFTGGTPCDLTNLERETEVVFKCAPGGGAAPAVVTVAEPATCRYSLSFATPVVCEGNDAAKVRALSHVKCRVVENASASGAGGVEEARDPAAETGNAAREEL